VTGRELIRITAKIKVSYISDQDLLTIVNLLEPMIRNVKVAKNNQGRYKKAYIELK